MARLVSWLLGFSLVLSAGCGGPSGPQGGTDVGNGLTLSLDVTGYEDTSFTSPQSLTLEDGVVIEEAYLAIDRIRLEAAVNGSCDEVPDSADVDVEGPVVANLVGAGVIGAAPLFGRDGDAFCELKVGYHAVDLASAPAGTPAAIDGLSLRVTGERADGTVFVVESRRNDAFELDAKDGEPFSFEPGAHTIFLAYELSSWIVALDLEGLGPGPIVIDEVQNADRLEAFEAAVEASARLFRDGNGDGVLSVFERDDGSQLAE